MKRRTVLKGVSSVGLIGTAGCMQFRSNQSSPFETTDERTISITSSDTIDAYNEVRIEPTVTEPRLTEEHPPRVRIETTNTGERRYFTSMLNGKHFGGLGGGDYSENPPGLFILADEDPPGEYLVEDGKWQYDPPDGDGPASSGIIIDTDETIANEYAVIDLLDDRGYYPPDEYRFERRVRIQSLRDGEPVSGSTARFTWGFSLKVTQDEPS